MAVWDEVFELIRAFRAPSVEIPPTAPGLSSVRPNCALTDPFKGEGGEHLGEHKLNNTLVLPAAVQRSN